MNNATKAIEGLEVVRRVLALVPDGQDPQDEAKHAEFLAEMKKITQEELESVIALLPIVQHLAAMNAIRALKLALLTQNTPPGNVS